MRHSRQLLRQNKQKCRNASKGMDTSTLEFQVEQAKQLLMRALAVEKED